MRSRHDTMAFVASVALVSVALSAVVWALPRTLYNPADLLIVIPVVSIILSARGASWRRKLLYGGLAVGVFLLVDFVFLTTGAMHFAFSGLSRMRLLPALLAIAYMCFAQGFPFVVLLLFVGRNPSMLWTSPKDGRSPA